MTVFLALRNFLQSFKCTINSNEILTIDGHTSALVLLRLRQYHGRDLSDVRDELVSDARLGVEHGDTEVDALGELEGVQVPAALLHLVGQGVDVEAGGL